VITANCAGNNLGKFCEKMFSSTENNDICLVGSFFVAADVLNRKLQKLDNTGRPLSKYDMGMGQEFS